MTARNIPSRLPGLLLVGIAVTMGLTMVGCESTAPTAAAPSTLPSEFSGEAFAPSSFVAAPILISDGPDYAIPTATRDQGERWLRVRIEYVVDPAGRVAAARVISSNDPAHAHTILRWLETARFVPGRQADAAVAVRMVQDFDVSYGPVRTP